MRASVPACGKEHKFNHSGYLNVNLKKKFKSFTYSQVPWEFIIFFPDETVTKIST